jgi:glycosyltransferase involved in cell wall biosynthesis
MYILKDYKVIVYTCAYNVEKILGRTIQSVLCQTHSNFEYHLLDNASTDGTWDVIQEYAQKDKRIVTRRFDYNTFGRAYEFICSLEDFSKTRYFVILDSDDEYVPHAFELLLKTMLETDAYIVGSNSFFIDAETGESRDTFTAESDMVIEGDGFDLLFPQYHKFMRTVWGKMYDLYRLHTLKPSSSSIDGIYMPPALSNAFTAYLFFKSQKIYIVKDRLYRYYIRSNSISRQYFNNRFGSIKMSYENNLAYLTAKIGKISAENDFFILYEAFKEVCITLPIIFSAKIRNVIKLQELIDIFSDEIVLKMYNNADFVCIKKYVLLDSVCEWLSTQTAEAGQEESKLVAELKAHLSGLIC